MPECSAVCFDLFNTLVSVGEVPDSIGRYTADVLGLDREAWNAVCFSEAHEICQPTEHTEILRTLAHSLNPGIPLETIAEAVAHRQARFDHALHEVKSTTLATLQSLKRAGFRLALISNASTGEVSAWSDSPLAPLFDVTLFSCECGLKKPDPAIYQQAILGLDVSARDCVYVGDGGSLEFQGATRSGFCTLLTREFLSPDRYQRVIAEQGESIDREIPAISELLGLLRLKPGTGDTGPGVIT